MITLDAITKRYGAHDVAVDALSLQVPDGELCVLVGPSGCGKTTTLRMINRLIEPSAGRILIDDVDVLAMDPVVLRRGIGYVIQQGGLFPHRRIADNVATVPRLLGWGKERVQDRVAELLELVGLDPERYGQRFPHELSGGERQRVGVARALGADPPVLLMDEPFGAVDPVTRQRLQNQFLDLQGELKKTVVFVTHDIEEAAKLGDRIAVLSKGGVLEQYDTPAEILGHPATEFVAGFVGSDRGVRRLAVVPITADDLFQPPVVGPTLTMAEVRAAVAAASNPGDTGSETGGGAGSSAGSSAGGNGAAGNSRESRWAVVVGEDGVMRGWVPIDSDVDGLVADRLTRFAVEVPLGSSLRTALAEMLQHDVSWVPVAEDGRYLGVLTPDGLHAAMRRSVGGQAVES